MMLLGWGTLAVPTGIVTAEMAARRQHEQAQHLRTCQACQSEGHRQDARYCFQCGAALPPSSAAD